MEMLSNYIKPELLVLSVVLYFIGIWMKETEFIKDKYIPSILGILGISLSGIWVLAQCSLQSGPDIAMALFTSIVQGILVAGLSTYANQLIKQSQKSQ